MGLNFSQFKTRLARSILRDDLAADYGEFTNEALKEIQDRRSWTCMKQSVFLTITSASQVPLPLTTTGTFPADTGDTVVYAVNGDGVTSGVEVLRISTTGSITSQSATVPALGWIYIAFPDDQQWIQIPTSAIGVNVAGSYAVTFPADGNPQTNRVLLPADFKELQKRVAVDYVTDDGGFVPADVVTEAEQIKRIWAFGGTPMQTWPPRVYYERQGDSNILGIVEPIAAPMNFRVKYYRYLPVLVADGDTSKLINLYPKMVLAKAKAIAFTEINDDGAAEKSEEEFEKKLAEATRQDAYSEVAGRETRM